MAAIRMSDTQKFNVTESHITRTPGVAGGEPCIAGRRIKVRNVYVWYDMIGMTADEIASGYNLSLAQVHAALTFAYEHLEDIREAIRAEAAFVEAFKKAYPSKLHLPSDDAE
jgi:uncharacterized protein (DUF433 family)